MKCARELERERECMCVCACECVWVHARWTWARIQEGVRECSVVASGASNSSSCRLEKTRRLKMKSRKRDWERERKKDRKWEKGRDVKSREERRREKKLTIFLLLLHEHHQSLFGLLGNKSLVVDFSFKNRLARSSIVSASYWLIIITNCLSLQCCIYKCRSCPSASEVPAYFTQNARTFNCIYINYYYIRNWMVWGLRASLSKPNHFCCSH